MGRPARFPADVIVDAARDLITEVGPGGASVAEVARRLGAPSGSIYHRFASRDLLVAHLWLRTVHRFHEGFVAAVGTDDGGASALRHTVTWARTNRRDAALLASHRRRDLLDTWPAELADALAGLNDPVRSALKAFATAHLGGSDAVALDAVRLALVTIPHALVRDRLARGEPITSADEARAEAAGRAVVEHARAR